MAENTTTLELHPMKKIEIIVKGDQAQFVRDLMERTGITGYTMIRDVAGMGHHGFHEGKLLFNDTSSLVVYVAVAPEETIGRILKGLRPMFEKHPGVMFVSDVAVSRLEYFQPAAA
ncbi:MAG: DUF190 domain-containing protein [Rhodospirillales bacterium]|nr:DUF190 domain-containing protein [Rhodospirillales bacterium]